MLGWWKSVSIAKKLYFVVGLMAFLIAGELLTLRFAMKNLSAARAFVGAESLWSKAQKNAVFSLQRFAVTKNEKDFQAYLEYLKIPEGDHKARIELKKKNPDLDIIRQGFREGGVHPEDIDPMIELLRRFYWISYLSKAIDIWTKGDELLFQLEDAGIAFHLSILNEDRKKSVEVLNEVKSLNENLTYLEEDFSFVLGQGSRWLENLVLSILTMAVLTVESIGLTLAFVISRAISRGLKEVNEVAGRIGQGDFSQRVNVHSGDEIGKLGTVVNTMGGMLQKSYGDLESRVAERTAELSKMAAENAALYNEAKLAVHTRDEFLSIASHELKTPLTSLSLQLQRLARYAKGATEEPQINKIVEMSDISVRLTRRLTTLLDELLDLTRLRIGKFELHREECNLVTIVSDVISQLSVEASRSGSVVSLEANKPIIGNFDPSRVGQIVTNLFSNAIKYGGGKPIDVVVEPEGRQAVISIRDSGIGIPVDQQSKIFERFERGQPDPNISGLGLGLYITKQITRAHGGTISVESTVGKGSTFTVRL